MNQLPNNTGTFTGIKPGFRFPNLNELRFIAAMMVFILHVEGVKSNFNLADNYASNHFYLLLGKLGVVLFFVLSGFLITFLLLKEETENNNIDVKKFYIRRILRIWPLYFLIVFFAFFVAPRLSFFTMPNFVSALNTDPFLPNLFLHLTFIPNLTIPLFGFVPYAGQLWSVGVEEQFYVLWPLLIKKTKNRLRLFIGVIVFYIAAKVPLLWLANYSDIVNTIMGFWYYFNIDCLAIGAIAAYFVVSRQRLTLKIVYAKPVQIIAWLLVLSLIAAGYQFKLFHYEIYGMLFAILILNLACNENSIVTLQNKLLSFLGKISYGIYMYHYVALTITIKILLYFNFANDLMIYSVGFILTILLSVASYYFFEDYFLQKKNKYSIFKK